MAKWFCITDFNKVVLDKSGCYAIYKCNLETHKKELLYIGTSQNLKTRLNRNKHEIIRTLTALLDFPEMPYIKCRYINNFKQRLLLEKKLIEKLNPKAN
jgi:excinuclease UvrABC nuclease subunit